MFPYCRHSLQRLCENITVMNHGSTCMLLKESEIKLIPQTILADSFRTVADNMSHAEFVKQT